MPETQKTIQTEESYVPLTEVALHLEISKDKLYYYFNNHADIAKEYLKYTVVKKGNGTVKRYFVRNDFVEFYEKTVKETEISESDRNIYERLYYIYLEREEKRLAEEGSSRSDENIFKDMEIIDANLSLMCLKALSKQTGKPPTSSDRLAIGNLVYRHIYGKKFYYDICINVLKELVAE